MNTVHKKAPEGINAFGCSAILSHIEFSYILILGEGDRIVENKNAVILLHIYKGAVSCVDITHIKHCDLAVMCA